MLRLIVIVIIVLQYMTVAFHYNSNNIKRTRNNLQPLNVLINNDTPKLTKFPGSLSNFNEKLVGSVKKLLILLYNDDSIYARFAALETIARVPYFAYISCLHVILSSLLSLSSSLILSSSLLISSSLSLSLSLSSV